MQGKEEKEEEEKQEEEEEEEGEEPVEQGRGRSAGRQHLLSPKAARQSSSCFQQAGAGLKLHLKCKGTATNQNLSLPHHILLKDSKCPSCSSSH